MSTTPAGTKRFYSNIPYVARRQAPLNGEILLVCQGVVDVEAADDFKDAH